MNQLTTTVTMNDGRTIPSIGLGVWQAARGEETYRAVRDALDLGYRHIDTAKIYGNERDVGRAIRESGIPRESIFVTTKLWNADHGFDKAKRALASSLSSLGLSYVDLYLIHWPQPERHESWRALVALRNEGAAKSIGVSNFTIAHLDALAEASPVVPAVNQVEFHPFLYQKELLAHCQSRGIVLEAYSPLARGERMGHPVVHSIAKDHGKSPAQILLRWGLQHDLVVIPKSVKVARIQENLAVTDFVLSPGDMARLDGLNENFRTCWDPTHAN